MYIIENLTRKTKQEVVVHFLFNLKSNNSKTNKDYV